jgi:hypothetical protein
MSSDRRNLKWGASVVRLTAAQDILKEAECSVLLLISLYIFCSGKKTGI